MTLHAGARLGAFEVLTSLGRGGMGEVYRARDTRLGREVAIKVLPDEVARDPERLRRFEREAKALAALKHPNIATLHGFERDSDVGFLVMELIEGETLADRIARGPIPWREAAALFEAIADGLKAAHESGIVHRDVKPANIKIDDEGHPKILDFGLAAMDIAAVGDAAAPVAVTHSPTLAVPTTMMGVLLGTAPYMAPEQARGLRVDRRADVWGFGCCLYEALTGALPFEGEEVSLVLAAVLASEPDWSRLPSDAPRELSTLVRRCLDKNPRRRLQDLGDARWSLAQAREGPADTVIAVPPPPARASARTWSAAAAIAGAALLIGAGIGWWARSGSSAEALDARSEPVAVAKFQVSTPFAIASTLQGRQIAVHPSGAAFAFASRAGGEGSIYLHDLREGTTRPISGTERGEQPFFARDGQWLGFVRESVLFKVPAGGGLPQRLCTLPAGLLAGTDWRGDRIVFAMWSGSGLGLWELPATGGDPRRLGETPLLATGSSPTFLADREAILFSSRGGDDADHIIQRLSVLDFTNGSVRDLGLEGRAPQYLDSGHLIWEGDDGLLAAEFDLDGQRIVGEPRPLLHLEPTSRLSALFAVSPNGTLVSVHPERFDLVEVAIDGTRRVLAAEPGQVRYPRYSPDGRFVAYSRGGIGAAQIWIHEVATGRESPIDDSPSHHVFPLWTPDGRVVYFEITGSRFSLRLADPERRGDAITLAETDQATIPSTVSAAGILLYENDDELWRIDLARPGGAEIWLREPATNASFSPDGRWVAYESNRSGARQVYVRRYPGPGGARPASVGDGGQPAWRADGRKLYFVSPRGLEEIDVELGDDDLRLGAARLVFGLEAPWAELRDPTQRPYGTRAYDSRPDGRAFIAAQRREDPSRFDVVIGLGRDLLDHAEGDKRSNPD